MQIDGARSDGAAAGKRDAGFARAGHQRPENQDGSAHRLDQIIGGDAVGQFFSADFDRARAFDFHAHIS